MTLIFELKDILLSFRMIFSIAGVALVCTFLHCTSGLKPWSVTTPPRYFKLSTSSNVLPWFQLWCICVELLVMSLPDLLYANYHAKVCRILFRWSSREASSSYFPAKLRMSSAKRINCWTFRLECWLFRCDLPVLSHNSLKKYVEKSRWQQTALSDFECGSEPVSYVVIRSDCTVWWPCCRGSLWLGSGLR